MAGPDFNVGVGEIVSFPEDEANRLVESGQAVFVSKSDVIESADLKTEQFEKKIIHRKKS